MTIAAFPMVEKAVRQVIEAGMPEAVGKTGGDPGFEPGDEFFVWISLIPGGSTSEIDGQWYIDIDVLAPSYAKAMQVSLDLEPVLLARRHVTETMRLDSTFQNEAPSERPWDDDAIFRVNAVYVFTARRTG